MEVLPDVAVARTAPPSGRRVDRRQTLLEGAARARSIEQARAGIPSRGRLRALVVVASDLVVATLGVLAGLGVANAIGMGLLGNAAPVASGGARAVSLVFVPAVLLLLWTSWMHGHYTRFRPFWIEVRDTSRAILYAGALVSFLLFVSRTGFSRLWLVSFLVLMIPAIPMSRTATRLLLARAGLWLRPTWIVGRGDNARATRAALESDLALGHRVVGWIDLEAQDARRDASDAWEDGLPVRSDWPGDVVHGETPCLVFAYESLERMNADGALLNRYVALTDTVTVVPPLRGLPLQGAEIFGVFRHEVALLNLSNRLGNRRSQIQKRLFDLVLGTCALILLSPLLAVVAALVASDGGPTLYRHRRLGREGRHFDCLKFRTMREDADAALARLLASDAAARAHWEMTHKLESDPRVTRVGGWLRRTSLDELPQLWNVIRGEMSLVGPRPIIDSEVVRYADQFVYYERLRPGLTGLWQISGRSDTSYATRVALDVWYSRNWSLWTDLVILLRTLPVVMSRRGAR